MVRIAFVTKKMVIGGTEKALLPMLKQFSSDEFDVDLYVQEVGGELFDEVPEWINVIQIPLYKDISFIRKLRHPIRLIDAIIRRLGMNEREEYYKQCERSCHCMPIIDKEYDVAIAYHAPDAVPFFYVIHNMKAIRKIMWIHFDIERTNGVNSLAKKYFSKYNKVFSVSKQAKEVFDKNYPSMIEKSAVFYNLIDVEEIRNKANIGPTFQDEFTGIRILSLGRLDPQKGYDRFLPIIKKLICEGYKVKLYLCGDGNQRTEIEELIIKLGLSENVVLLGMQENPYGYLKDCDIYVQPSRNEGYCTTTNEARIFAKPILVTDVCGMREQFKDHVNGSIVSESKDDIYKGMKELLDSPSLCQKYSQNLSLSSFNREIDIYRIIKER